MHYPDFFDTIPRLQMHDPLADFLGAAEGGCIEYAYLDAVKLAGHSCPTVASAYWLTCQALRALYGATLPERGGVQVTFRDSRVSGVTGVIAQEERWWSTIFGAGPSLRAMANIQTRN